ncbi:MAG: TetR/AcrR family transcriptional regulator [Solirubrobacterales bacterium]
MKLTDSMESPVPHPAPDKPAARARLPRRVRETQMIDVATEVFGKHGYHAASMDQIAEQAQISKPMIYAYFESKEGLYSACLRRAGADLLESIGASSMTDGGTEQRLWESFLAYFRYIRDNRAAWQLVRVDSFYEVAAFREIAESVHEGLRDVVAGLVNISPDASSGAGYAEDERRNAIACAMLGAAEALGSRWIENSSEPDPESPCRHLMSFLWLGIEDLANGEVWTEQRIRV